MPAVAAPRLAPLLLIASLLVPAARAQGWSIEYDDFDGYDLASASDGGLLVLGRTRSMQPVPAFLRLDALGNPAWRVDLGAGAFSSLQDCIATPAGFLVTGYVDGCGGYVAHLAANGSVDWQSCTDQGSFRRVVTTTDGGYVLAGEGFPFPALKGVVRLDGAGGLAWARGFFELGNSAPSALVPLPGGGVLYAFGGDPGNGQTDAWFFAFDAGGSLLWKRAYTAADNQEVLDAVPTGDGGAFVLIRSIAGFNWRDQVMVRLAANGSLVWTASLRGACDIHPEALARATDGGVLVVGSSYGPSFRPQRWMAHVAPNGSVDWQRVGPERTFFNSVAQAAGGGWFLGDYPYRIDRVDEMGLAATNCTQNPSTPCAAPPSTLTEIPLQNAPAPFTITLSSASLLAPISPQPLTACPLGACAPLACGAITATPPTPCSFDQVALTLDVQGGEAPFTITWDLDGDGAADMTGNPVTTIADAAGNWQVDASVTDGCTLGAQSCTARLVLNVPRGGIGEVSDVRAGSPPLLLRRGAPGVRVERLPSAIRYDAYVDRLGSWYSPMSSGLSACALTAWVDNGDGTITLAVDPPAGTWLLVTAHDACGEGSAGRDSLGNLRSSAPGWQSCP